MSDDSDPAKQVLIDTHIEACLLNTALMFVLAFQ
jgi:hypothetical protein